MSKNVKSATKSSAQAIVCSKGVPSGLSDFLAGLSIETGAPSHGEEGMLMMHLKLVNKSSDITKQKSLREVHFLLRDMEENAIIKFVSQIAHVVINHSHHPNSSVRLASYVVLRTLMEKGKIVKQAVVPDLGSLSGPWVMAMHDADPGVQNEAVEAFNAAFSPEKRSLMLQNYKDNVLRYVFQQLEHISENITAVKQSERETMSDTVYSALLTMGYLITQVSTSQAAVISFLETPLLQKLISPKGKISETDKALFLFPPARAGVLTLLRDVVTVCPLSPTIHALVGRSLETSMSDSTVYTAKRVWELLLCWCRAAGAATIIPYFPKRFLDTIVNAMMKCEAEDLAEIIFPSIFPLLAQLSKFLSSDRVIDEFCGALIEKIHLHMEKQPLPQKVLSMIFQALLSCWELHAIRHGSSNTKDTLELFTVILLTFSDLLVAESKQHEWYLQEIGSVLAISLLKTLVRSEELFAGCMGVLCTAKDAPFVVFSASEDGHGGALSLPSREGYHHLQNATIGCMCREVVRNPSYDRWVRKLEEYYMENIQVCVKDDKDLSQVAMTIRFADPLVFVPAHSTVEWIAECLTAIFHQWWDPVLEKASPNENFVTGFVPCEEENIHASKYILETVLRWKELMPEKKLKTLILSANVAAANVMIRHSVEEYLMENEEEWMKMLLDACLSSNLESLNRYIRNREKANAVLELSGLSVKSILEAVGKALTTEIRGLEGVSHMGSKELENTLEKSGSTNLSPDTSVLTPVDGFEDAGEESQMDIVSASGDPEEEISLPEKTNRASSATTPMVRAVAHRLRKWIMFLHPHKGGLGKLFKKDDALQNLFFSLVGEKMLLLLSIVAPCLYPEYYLSPEALHIALQDTEDVLIGAVKRKVNFVTTHQFKELSSEIKDLFTAYDTPILTVDEWYKNLWNRLLDEGIPDGTEVDESEENSEGENKQDGEGTSPSLSLLAVQQIQQLLPLASPKLLRGIASSEDVWETFRVESVEALDMAPLFDGHYTLDQMQVSLYSTVRTGQMIRFFDFCEANSYFASEDAKMVGKSDRMDKQRAKRFYLLLRAAMTLRLFSNTICAQLYKLLRTVMLQLGGDVAAAHLVSLMIETEEEVRDPLICTLSSIVHITSRSLEPLERSFFVHFVLKVGRYLAEFMIKETISTSGSAGINASQVSYYSIFFQFLDNTADTLRMNLLLPISEDLLALFKEACCLLSTFDHRTVKMCLLIHRHLAARLEINETTAKSLIMYAQRQNSMDGLEVLAELSCCRVLHPIIFGELVRCILHSMGRVYQLKHLPTNGRLMQASTPQRLSKKVDFQFLWRSVIIATTARKGVVLHSRLDSVLRGTVNLLIYDVVCECVSHLRDASKMVKVPQLTKLLAFTVEFLSTLMPEDVSVLRGSEGSTHTIASMFAFVYLWLCATPLVKLEAIGLDTVAGVMRAACLLANLTLVKSGIPLTSQLDPIISKIPIKALRNDFSSSNAFKLRAFRSQNTLLRRTRKHSLALFPFLIGWAAFLTNTDPSPDLGRNILRAPVCTLLDILLTLLLSPRVPGSSHLESTFLWAMSNIKEEQNEGNMDSNLALFSSQEHDSLAASIGSALHSLTCKDSHDLMGALAKCSEVLLTLLLHGPTLPLVKEWVDTVEKKTHDLIFQFVRCRISSLMTKEALQRVLSRSPDATPVFSPAEHMTVEVSMANRDILLTYEVEEDRILVRITFPPEYPLVPPRLEYRNSERECGVSIKKWRAWMMKMSAKLFGGGLNIWDCIVLFQRNVDAHFSGLEPCPVCFAVISPLDAKIPELQCSSCNNSAKFHSSCLNSWWSTSGNVVCPLCRAPWSK